MANSMRWTLIPASRPLDSENHQGWRCKHNRSRSWSLVSLWLVPGIICAGFSSSQRDHICSAAKEANKRLMFISPTISISFPSAQAVSSMLEVVPELPTRIWSLLNCATSTVFFLLVLSSLIALTTHQTFIHGLSPVNLYTRNGWLTTAIHPHKIQQSPLVLGANGESGSAQPPLLSLAWNTASWSQRVHSGLPWQISGWAVSSEVVYSC